MLTIEQDSTSFFSVQLAEDTIVAHNGTVNFDRVIVNFGLITSSPEVFTCKLQVNMKNVKN